MLATEDKNSGVAGPDGGINHKLWALRDEDSNPALTLIDPITGVKTDFTYAQKPLPGGGYDDVVFAKGETFISASNPIVDARFVCT